MIDVQMTEEARRGFPLVTLPGANLDEVSFVRTLLGEAREREDFVREQRRGMAAAMVRLGKPIFRSGKPKRRKPTAHVRRMARLAERSTR